MSTTIPDSIRRQVNAASALIARIIEGDLVAVHLYGSAVEGGLKPQSDIDLLVTIRQPLNTRQRKDLMQGFLEISAPPGSVDSYRALEVTIVVYSQLVPLAIPTVKRNAIWRMVA